ncbi:Golgi resident protein GCP60 [Taenia solium]|eukprot:TsM_001235000 transcript=TsM_001235000 gene=TsM_001235000
MYDAEKKMVVQYFGGVMSQNEADMTCGEPHVAIAPENGDTEEVKVGVVVEDEEKASSEEHLGDAEERRKQESAMRSILDQQSIIQFRQYAQEQHPKDVAKQDELIRQMQDQYFEYYMENVQRSQIINQQRQIDQLLGLREASRANALNGGGGDGAGDDYNSAGEPIPLPLIPASVWTRGDIADFKKDILTNHRESCIKISSLASATLRVPTHEEGSSIFWEFATDSYDLGFGLFFEWNLTPQENITITISESSDEEEEEEGEEDGDGNPVESASKSRNNNDTSGQKTSTDEADVESGGGNSRSRKLANTPTDELIPVYRRDCHTEVYCGSHQYPGCGVYVFKFDNSFSLWRSKWLYYRIFYGNIPTEGGPTLLDH